MTARLIVFLLIFIPPAAYSQYFSREKELVQQTLTAQTQTDQVVALGNLAEFYYIFRADQKGDSVLQKQLVLAEMSNNKDLIFQTLFWRCNH